MNIIKEFDKEFAIHFSASELVFVHAFLEEMIDKATREKDEEIDKLTDKIRGLNEQIGLILKTVK